MAFQNYRIKTCRMFNKHLVGTFCVPDVGAQRSSQGDLEDSVPSHTGSPWHVWKCDRLEVGLVSIFLSHLPFMGMWSMRKIIKMCKRNRTKGLDGWGHELEEPKQLYLDTCSFPWTTWLWTAQVHFMWIFFSVNMGFTSMDSTTYRSKTIFSIYC